jgi:sugar phosphate isomerase/epimerase
MYKYSVTQWIAGSEPVEVTLKRLGELGYDGVEFAAEPDQDLDALRRGMAENKLFCTSLCGMFPASRDLASSSAETRKTAKKYLHDCVDMAVTLGSPLIIVVPSAVGKTAPDGTYGEAWDNARGSIREAADYAGEKGVTLALEAVNRYETFLASNLTLLKKLMEEVAHPSVKMMADLFHMSLEERSLEGSLRMVAPHLVHVHVADNTREPAGFGRTDFLSAFKMLHAVGYKGAVAMEFLPPVANPYLAAGMDSQEARMALYMRQSLEYVRAIVRSVERAENA